MTALIYFSIAALSLAVAVVFLKATPRFREDEPDPEFHRLQQLMVRRARIAGWVMIPFGIAFFVRGIVQVAS